MSDESCRIKLKLDILDLSKDLDLLAVLVDIVEAHLG